jgi:diguanylate cyclase (GGDEF)-like protein
VDPTAKYLFEYLRNVLYHPSRAKLIISDLPEGFRELGEGLMFFTKCINEIRTFTKALAAGDLNVKFPSYDNEMAAPLKTLHSTLKHLSWQTQQVASGDYSQKVDYLGDFADAFNSMTRQLDERRRRIMEEIEISRQKTVALQQCNDLFETVTKENSQWLVVIERETNKWLFFNYPVIKLLQTEELIPPLKEWLDKKAAESGTESDLDYSELELAHEQYTQYFTVMQRPVVWRESPSVVFMLTDDSKRREFMKELEYAANYDSLTKLFNRDYGMRLLNRWLAAKETFALCFADMDNLKYVNDKYGHLEGDKYINLVSSLLKLFSPDITVCRIGGDEFMLLELGWTKEDSEEQLEALRNRLIRKGESSECPYYTSMSYGVVEVTPQNIMSASELLAIADERMYQYKRAHKMGRA